MKRDARVGVIAVAIGVGTLVAAGSATARADDFEAGSLIIPMDLDYQDAGMLRAFGLVYELLRNHVPVRWVIRTGKNFGEADFTTASVDLASGGPIAPHGYRAGPWVVDASDAAEAMPIVMAWQASYPETTVHEATDAFTGDVARYLVVAPTIAMLADGNQDIARGYMLAAAIPDSTLDLAWPNTSPDMLDIDELMGPTDTAHTDGLLFDEDGDPVYCQLMSMHWGVGNAEDNPEVVAEVRAFLNNPTHFFAECQAVNAFENLDPHGFFLTPHGFEIGPQPNQVEFFNPDSPFGQIDGEFDTVGGSEPSYSLPAGDMYKAGDIVMITGAGTPEGQNDVWMTGFLDGQCPPSQHECGQYGKISYLGGHRFSTDMPMSNNPDSQGARMFLNSLFEAPCATVEGLPTLAIVVGAPAQTTVPEVTLSLSYVNTSFATALDVVLRDPLPAGATFVSASGGGVLDGDTVVWDLGNLGPGESGDLEIEVVLAEYGVYPNGAALEYRVGLNAFALDSNVTQTEYGESFGTSGGADEGIDDTQGDDGSSGQGQSDDDAAPTTGATVGDTDGTSSESASAGEAGDSGCGCRTDRTTARWPLLLGVLALGLRRRRRMGIVAMAASLGCAAADSDDSSGPGRNAIANASVDMPAVPKRPRDLFHRGTMRYEIGAYIIPMDNDYQDDGIFRAFGLVYELLLGGVTVHWVIEPGKSVGDPDFSAQAVALVDGVPQGDPFTHEYRAGPWVIRAQDAEAAAPIITAWQEANPQLAVHQATEPFDGFVARTLEAAPTIAMFADGNQDIARGYVQAAGIPDSTGDLGWPNASPDMLTVADVVGPSERDHSDGALFDDEGNPAYCQLMSMHWGVGSAESNPDVVAEVRSFLNHSTHFFAECQAVNAFENLDPHGFYLTTSGFEIGSQPNAVEFLNADQPFTQIDGGWQSVGGSEPAYTLPEGESYKDGDVVLITQQGTPAGINDVWMTGYLDGACPPNAEDCNGIGKISYLGGHRYDVDLPISANPSSQGTRMFLNSLFEAPCATAQGRARIELEIDGPIQTTEAQVAYTIQYFNVSPSVATATTITYAVPEGAALVDACCDGAVSGNEVRWDVGTVAAEAGGTFEVTVELSAHGSYESTAKSDYVAGLTPFTDEAALVTEYADAFGTSGDALDDSGDAGEATGMTAGGDSNDGDGSGATDGDSAGAGTDDGGCGCTQGRPQPRVGWMIALALLGVRRRRIRSTVAVALATIVGGCGDGPAGAVSSGTATDSDGVTATLGDDGDDDDDGAPKLDAVSQTDTPFAPSGCQKIDFLFVIDSSESMKDHQQNLITSFPGFADAIEAAVLTDDWHVMVVDTDGQWSGADCANACATLGLCPDAPEFSCDTPPPTLCDIRIGSGEVAPYGEGASNTTCLEDGPRYIAGGADELAERFSCIAQVGVDGNSHERQGEALVQAIAAGMNDDNGCNAGFLREDAILVITVISDEPDEVSEGEPQGWFESILSAKADDATAIVVLGLLADGDTAAPQCPDPVPATRIADLLASFPNTRRASVCEPDYGPFFAEAVGVIAQTCEDFVPPG